MSAFHAIHRAFTGNLWMPRSNKPPDQQASHTVTDQLLPS
jgi:hypothetical protein